MDDIRIRHLTVGPLGTNCFLVSCVKSSEAIIIDPGGDSPSIISAIKEDCLTPVMIVLTHGHSDHMASAAGLTREFDIDIAMHGDDIETMKKSVEDSPLWGLGEVEYPEVKTLLSAGDKIEFGEIKAEVRHTPGHTLGGISIVLGNAVFAGDTLFAGSIGRTDFFGGDMETLLASIRSELFTLPDDTAVFCGHGPPTTIGEEKARNPYLNGTF